jgi:TolB-like protein/DNA-binding winged helix-turn-helix (wHTH) protein/tetratricopeptide (TPR) repeat protein
MTRDPNANWLFGPFCLDPEQRVLLRDGKPIALTTKAFEILNLLVENHGRALSKEEMMRQVWPDSFVDDSNLAQHIFHLRKVLGDTHQGGAYIETLPRRGYRFVAGVQSAPAKVAEAALAAGDTSQSAISVPRSKPTKLRWVIGVVAGLVLAVITLAYVERGRIWAPKTVISGKVMLAVLAFENLSGDPQQEYLSNGLTEELITQLGSLEPNRLGVIARTSAMQYKGSLKDVRQISRELGVDYVLEGSVRRDGERVRITAQLIQVKDQTHLWAKEYDRDLKDILGLESEVAGEVAREIRLRLTPVESARLTKAHSVDPDAYEFYLKGRYFWNKRNEAAYVKAIDYFNQAIARDPQYARAYSGLADAYALLGSWPNAEMPRRMAMPRAKEAALTALKLDDSLAEAHASLAFVEMHYEWNWKESEREFQRAIELNPNYATAHQWFAYWLMAQGRPEESIAENELARKADPLSIIIRTDAADLLCAAGRFDEAIQKAREAMDLDPDFRLGHYFLGLAYSGKQMYPEALAEYQAGITLDSKDEWSLSGLGWVYALMQDRMKAEEIIRRLRQDARERPDLALEIAIIYSALGEKNEAFAWLEKAYQDRDGGLMLVNSYWYFAAIRSDPRFAQFVRKIGLPEQKQNTSDSHDLPLRTVKEIKGDSHVGAKLPVK